MKSTVKLTNKNNFKAVHPEKLEHNGEYELEKGKFLLSFDYDPEAQKEGLDYISYAVEKGYKPAIEFAKKMKDDPQYNNALNLYKFVYGKYPFNFKNLKRPK